MVMRSIRRLAACAAMLSVSVALAACSGTRAATDARVTSSRSGSAGTTPVLDRATVRYSLGGASITIPKRWSVTPYRGEPATVVFPIAFLSDSPLTGPCAAKHPHPALCTTQNWFPPGTRTPANGVLVLWINVQFPTAGALNVLPGRLVRINGHTARVDSGPANDSCPAGTARQIAALVRIPTHTYGPSHYLPGGRIDMVACLGANASHADSSAIRSMMRSLRIRPRYWYPR